MTAEVWTFKLLRNGVNMLKSLVFFIAFLFFLIGLFFMRSRKIGALSPESRMIIDALNSIGNGKVKL